MCAMIAKSGRILLILCGLFSSIATEAITLRPLREHFITAGSESQKSLTVINDLSFPIAVQATVYEKVEDQETGEVKEVEVENEFLVYPLQFVLMGNEEQTLQVRWMGDVNLKEAKRYQIRIEQLPVPMGDLVDLPEGSSQGSLMVTLQIAGSLYVSPPGAQSQVTVTKISAEKGEEDQLLLGIELKNTGTGHAFIGPAKLDLIPASGEGAISLSPTDLKDLYNRVLIPGETKLFTVPWPDFLPQNSDYKGVFSYESYLSK